MSLLMRLSGYLLVLWLAASANFLLPRLLPGDPVEFLVGEEVTRLTLAQRTAILAQFGLDQPLFTQYVNYLSSLARLDLGASVSHGTMVLDVIAGRTPWTLALVGSAILLAFVTGFLLACWFHWVRSARSASLLMAGVVSVGSLPPFWVGMVMIAIFAVRLGWFPSHGAVAPEAEAWIQVFSLMAHAALPVTTLTLSYIPAVFLIARAGLEEALSASYVALAHTQGAGRARILFRQAAPNAALPLVNQFAMSFGGLLGGTVTVETVFAYPGLGLTLYEGILAHDFPLVQGIFLLLVFTVVLANLTADVAQVLLDPRLRRARWREA
jgi:peptide/nickel transport system permease protein